MRPADFFCTIKVNCSTLGGRLSGIIGGLLQKAAYYGNNKGIRFKTVAELVRASKAKRKSSKKLVAQKILNFWKQLEVNTNNNAN